MQNFNIIKESIAEKTFRVESIMGKYNLQTEHIRENFIGSIDLDKDWNIGCIVGASGTGKTTIAKELFKDYYIGNYYYNEKSILDNFPSEISIKDICKILNSVGFSSVPSWLKSYSVLSEGEKMRVNLARALLENKKIIVFDEFTSVIDRNVAKIGSYAVSKVIKRMNKKFVAVSCHYDILNWLEPDWIFDTNEMTYKYVRGELQRPKIKIKIYQRKGMWNIFKKYHYLNSEIHRGAKQFIGYINNIPVAFCGVLYFPHPIIKNMQRCTRLIVLPDYQGIGIGCRLLEFVANLFIKKGNRFSITTSTPSLINYFNKSKKWILKRQGRNKRTSKSFPTSKTVATERYTTSWEYICN